MITLLPFGFGTTLRIEHSASNGAGIENIELYRDADTAAAGGFAGIVADDMQSSLSPTQLREIGLRLYAVLRSRSAA